MSKDPLEELFGSAAEDLPEPKPARDRLAQEQAERVRTRQLQTAGAAAPDRAAKLKPWIVVGVIAVLAIVASTIVLQLARGGDADPSASTPSQQTETSEPAPTDTVEPGETTPPDDEEEPDESDDSVPKVEVGEPQELLIGPWDATSELSKRFGYTMFSVPDNVNLTLTSELLDSFPESCEAMRSGWGATRLADGSYEIRKPETRCAEAPELYDEVWGLVDAWVKTIRPAG